MTTYRKLVSPFLLVISAALTMPVHAAQDTSSKAEARQSTEDTSPKGQYQTSKKEAEAAYRQALADCKQMRATERKTCMKEAKSNYQADLSEAKKLLSSGQ